MSLRVVVRLSFALGIAALLAVPGVQAQPAGELIVSTYGGRYEELVRESVPEFERATNSRVVFVAASGAAALARARNKEVDVVHLDLAWGTRGEAEGLFERLRPELLPNMRNLFNEAKISPYTVATNFGVFGIAYNPKFVPKPTSWLDLWKPEFKGRVSARSFADETINLLVLMAKLNGGNEKNIDPGFRKMAELGRNIDVWYTAHPQALTLFKTEQIHMAVWTNARAFWAKGEGANVEFVTPREGGFPVVSTVHVVRGRKGALGMRFINHLLSEGSQRSIAEGLQYAPVNRTVEISAEIKARVPYGPAGISKLLFADWKEIIPQLDVWAERWQKEVVRR